MSRTKAFDPDKALLAAMDVFWCKGYEGTSVADLLDGMGINRGSLYDTFGDKHTLYLKTLERYRDIEHRKIAALVAEIESPMGFVEQLLQGIVEQAVTDPHRRGCFINNTIVETAPHDEAVCNFVTENDTLMDEVFVAAFERAKTMGEISQEANVNALSAYFRSAIHGLRVTSKANPDRHVLQTIVDGTMFTLRNNPF